ncbi:MAG: hypothetical protein HQL69_19375 [Magnetococcales bacterium]|nr:hypothetical protein [Magnetococcales bacterium]
MASRTPFINILYVVIIVFAVTYVVDADAAWKLVCSDSLSPQPLNNKGQIQDCANGTQPVWVEDSIFDVLTLDQDAISLIMMGTMAFYISGLFFGACMRLFQRFIAR